MREYIEKIKEVEISLSKELGEFNLFGLLEREDIIDKWDILVSLTLSKDKNHNKQKNSIIKKLHEELIKNLPNSIFFKFSRIVFLEPSNPFVLNINMLANVQHGDIEIKDSTINNLRIKHAYIISSKRE
ncbi:hypothetical protein [Winogradskyella sp.]|uniref:hypothetical protein n=1 Tax=Winogradskyella sp. TaxID=1883156 RepID=UPI003AA90365